MIEVPIFDFQHCFQACVSCKKKDAIVFCYGDIREDANNHMTDSYSFL